MANIYIRSTDGSDSDNGTTWALAKATINGAAGIDAAGDTYYVSSAHAESTASSVTWALAGTNASPVKILGVSDAAEPPTALATGATITVTGSNALTLNGSCYMQDISMISGAAITLNGTGGRQVFESCDFKTTNSGSAGAIQCTAVNVPTETVFKNCTFYYTNTGNASLTIYHNAIIRGCSFKSGSVTPSGGFLKLAGDGRGATVLVEGCDFTNAASTLVLWNNSSNGSGKIIFRNCKLPDSWTGSIGTSLAAGIRVEMHNCDSADTNYRYWAEDYSGSIKTETTLIKTGGASDGTTGFSLKMVSGSNSNWHSQPLIAEIGSKWNSTTGSSITVTVDILRDSATNLKNDEVWLEIQYMGTSGRPISTFINNTKTDIFATAADQTTSSATWTTTGMSNPNKQKLAVTFTPTKAGYISARVFLAKTSTTVYIDPVMQVS